MEMTSATAELVKADDLDAELAAITATISRAEVEEALGAAEPPELFLELMRDGDERFEVSVAWRRDDLERLLDQAEGDAIRLMFERNGLERAVDDVEVHGLRDRALVLTVAAATAAAAASATSNAAAAIAESGTTGVQPVVTSVHDEAGAHRTRHRGDVDARRGDARSPRDRGSADVVDPRRGGPGSARHRDHGDARRSGPRGPRDRGRARGRRARRGRPGSPGYRGDANA